MVISHRVEWGSIKWVSAHGDQRFSPSPLELTAVWKSVQCVSGGTEVHKEKLKDLCQKTETQCWKPSVDTKRWGKDWSSSERKKQIHPSSISSCHSIQVMSSPSVDLRHLHHTEYHCWVDLGRRLLTKVSWHNQLNTSVFLNYLIILLSNIPQVHQTILLSERTSLSIITELLIYWIVSSLNYF